MKEHKELAHPVWDAAKRELWFHGRLVKKLHRAAPQQALILASFQELGWPQTIPNPVPPVAERTIPDVLNDALGNLNRGMDEPIHFTNEESGRSIGWHVR
jgi:hypothetical protein